MNQSIVKASININSTHIYFIEQESLNILIYKYDQQIDFNNDEINLFISHNNEFWIAIDNSNCALLMEDFSTSGKAIQYLLHE